MSFPAISFAIESTADAYIHHPIHRRWSCRGAMAKNHRIFHRRAAPVASPTAVTANVHVVTTIAANSSLTTHDTHALTTPLATTPTQPSPPLLSVSAPLPPSVPVVPPFPSSLKVPSVVPYPWPSDVAAAEAAGSTTPTQAIPPSNTPQSGVSPSSLSATLSPLSAAKFSSQRSIATTGAESIITTADAASSTLSPADGIGSGDDRSAYTVVPPAAATGASSISHAGIPHPPPLTTSKVVGSVIGSLAGAALILAIILILIRRYKHKRDGAVQLMGEHHSIDSKRSMRQPLPSSNINPTSFFSRFSTVSRSTIESTFSGGERGFQKVSGRKLPSIFSEGMTSEQFASGAPTSGASFYQDEKERGGYVSPTRTNELDKEVGHIPTTRESGPMNIRPGPARTPVIRHPDENPFADLTYLSPPQTPNRGSPRRGSLGRSLPSADVSRSSRFTENV